MAVHLTLSVDDAGAVRALHAGTLLTEPTPSDSLPRISRKANDAESNPYRFAPQELGERLFAAMGGGALLSLLEADDEWLLLLETDVAAAQIPWEYAATPERRVLALEFGFLRLLPTAPPARPAPDNPLNLLVLAADPLVADNAAATPRTGYKLDIETELQAIRHKLAASERALTATRLPPTIEQLQGALKRGPAVLHLSCHGNVIPVMRGDDVVGWSAVLQLEDQDGKSALLPGNQLMRLAPAGVLRLVVLSACRTAASALDADLAQALVHAGIPAAVGMQGNFPDPLSDDFAATLYEFLLEGYPLSEALRQARAAMAQHPDAVGLPVGYVARGGNAPLPVKAGLPAVGAMARGRWMNLPNSLQAPRFFVGREAALHALARTFSAGNAVVTVVGTGGIGKTALAASFAARFGWRWAGGVVGTTVADLPTLDPATVARELLGRLIGEQALAGLADLPLKPLEERLLAEAQARRCLILVDNYESVLQAMGREGEPGETEPHDAASLPDAQLADNASRLHRLVATLAQAGVPLLLTSRQHPAGLAGEVLFPPRQGLGGVEDEAGTALFLHHSTRAKENPRAAEPLARAVAQATEGHPLAIALLAGEWDNSREKGAEDFLAGWDEELEAAQRDGMAAHHVTFAVAFRRSFDHLTPEQQRRLVALSRFPAPFFAEGAAFLWQGALPDEGGMAAVRAELEGFVQRSLLQVAGWYEGGDRAATYRLEPVIARALHRYRQEMDEAEQGAGYRAYADWLVSLFRRSLNEPALIRLAQQWVDELILQAEGQPEEGRGWYAWRLGALLAQFGRLHDQFGLLEGAEQVARKLDDAELLSRVLYDQAQVHLTRGDLNEAMRLYEQSLTILEQVGDLQGKGATLANMAQVHLTRGDLNEAMRLYEQSLTIREQVGDLKGKGATLHNMAQVHLTRGDLNEAMRLYEQSLTIREQVGDLQGKGATLANMAQVHLTRGDLNEAMRLYEQRLTI